MIDLKHYERVLDSGLMLDHYLVLCMVKSGSTLPNNKRVQGFLNLLNKKGYINDGMLTDEGVLLTEIEITTVTTEKDTKQVNFTNWVVGLHARCQNRLKELTGLKQVRSKIDKSSYNFLPNSTDLAKVLHKVIVLYKLKDMEKIERVMMGHIDKCYNARSWFPLMKYYIIKNNSSDMVTDLESVDDGEEVKKSTQKFI